MYADITIWGNSTDNTKLKENLKRAADTRYARERGRECALEKSEVLILKNPQELLAQDVTVRVDGKEIWKQISRCWANTFPREEAVVPQ